MEEKKDQGFRVMAPEKVREIASKGGIAAHEKGTAHEWTSAEAREAGRKGGAAKKKKREEASSAIAAQSGNLNFEPEELKETA